MAIVSLEGHWVEVNQALCRSLGYPEADLVGDTVETFVHPSDFSTGELEARLLADEISTGQVERRFIRRDGTVVWMRVSCSLVRDELGDPEYFVTQCEDITSAKAIERELARERLWLTESQVAGRIGSWELDLETGLMRWSKEQFNLYGVDPSVGVPGLDQLLELIHADDRGAMLESLRHHAASGEDFIDEYRIRHSRLGARALLVRGRFLPRDPELGRPARMSGTTLDVTAGIALIIASGAGVISDRDHAGTARRGPPAAVPARAARARRTGLGSPRRPGRAAPAASRRLGRGRAGRL